MILKVHSGKPTKRKPQGEPAKHPVGPNAFAHLVHALASDRNAAIAAIRVGFAASVIKDASAYVEVMAARIRTSERA